MAFLGRESEADRRRAERFRQFVQARSPYALISPMMGLVSAVDFFTIVLGAPLGLVAIVAGVLGLRDLARRPHLLGRRLCLLGIVLGALGIVLTAAFLVWLRSRSA